TVLQEVRNLKEKLDQATLPPKSGEDHPTILKIVELLQLNDFSYSYINSIQNRLKRDFSLEALDNFSEVQDQVVDWIGESIGIYTSQHNHLKPRIMILVGPTGVGKTTTIAKLAALYGCGIAGTPPISVRMITIDNYRIAAKQQIETYGDIMNIPVSCVETYEDLRQTISMYAQDVDLVLIDTIGKSPRDTIKLAEMKQILSACGSLAEVHLAMAASTKTSDIKEILQQYEPFNYQSVIVTKLDETSHVGNIISALSERGKMVSFITNGQRVPMDIERASAVRFLVNLEGFRINRPRIDEKFINSVKIL
ncbi:MAG: AAA family ATPase, partial [Termitinemataceae bacterium]